jgi:hypothetical protein
MLGIKIKEVKDPGPLKIEGKLVKWDKYLKLAPIAIILVYVLAIMSDKETEKLFWQHYVINLFFFSGFAFFGILFSAIHHSANVTWSANVRRIAEGFTGFIPYSLVCILILGVFGINYVYDWSYNKEVFEGFSHIKQLYLSQTGFFIKQVVFYAMMLFFTWKIVGFSLKQDENGDPNLSKKAMKWSIPFIFLFAYLFTVHVVDLLMAINSQWFSTMFGVYCFAGIFLSGFVLLAIITSKNIEAGYLKDSVKEHHLKDLGTWIMGFSCFMVYIGFSQFMLIWYANMPAEVAYMIPRMENGWEYIFIALPLLKWIVPFVFLMPWKFRANPKAFKIVGGLVLLGQYLDIFWMVMPGKTSPAFTGWIEPLMFIGFAGLFYIAVTKFYTKHSLLAHKDPRVLTSLNAEHL